MGQWSESKQDYPEENAANYVNGRFDPKAAQALRDSQLKQAEQARLGAEVRTHAQRHRPQPKG
jgi:hypothetical protein